jgi:hypothetical protein
MGLRTGYAAVLRYVNEFFSLWRTIPLWVDTVRPQAVFPIPAPPCKGQQNLIFVYEPAFASSLVAIAIKTLRLQN